LPQNGTVKKAGKTYMQEPPTMCGMPVGKPRWKEMPTKADKLRETLQRPAIWALGVSLPLGLVLGAVMLVGVSNPVAMRIAGTGAGICLVTAVGAGAWIAATMWLWAIAPIVCIGLYIGYRRTKGKRLTIGNFEHV